MKETLTHTSGFGSAFCIKRGCGKPFDPAERENRDTATLRAFWRRYCPAHRYVGKQEIVTEQSAVGRTRKAKARKAALSALSALETDEGFAMSAEIEAQRERADEAEHKLAEIAKRREVYQAVNAILEIAADANGTRELKRSQDAIAALRGGTIAGRPVVYANLPYEEPTRVPGFNHDNRCCTPKGCVCRVQPYSVLRYFGLHCVVQGELGTDDMRDYRLTEYAELHVCGIGEAGHAGTESLLHVRATS